MSAVYQAAALRLTNKVPHGNTFKMVIPMLWMSDVNAMEIGFGELGEDSSDSSAGD
jgi:hypothetical protein